MFKVVCDVNELEDKNNEDSSNQYSIFLERIIKIKIRLKAYIRENSLKIPKW